MSLIISYISSKGCVMIGDKRRIGFLGNEKKREALEQKLYSGEIKTQKELLNEASELEISLKITDDAVKVRKISDVLVGEVKYRTPSKTFRKRIYGTTHGYHLVKLTGSNISSMEHGGSSIVVFGNQITKKLANETINQHWKSKTNLQEVGELFQMVMEEVAPVTPSVSKEYDLLRVHPTLDKKASHALLRSTIVEDVKDLAKWRAELKDKMLTAAREIEIASRIMTEGVVGTVESINNDEIEVKLGKGVLALNTSWNVLAQKDQTVKMRIEDPSQVTLGDLVVIRDENLCISRSGANLSCDIILCNE
ncbi:MAG: DUF2121 domain-containing protein [Methanobacteriaceae archaeon]|nr:DUF2121 domain-containing protein [Methanobacteriaceae archaeon]